MVVFLISFLWLLAFRRMNSADRNDLVPAPAQEKLEWVTPKISLMETDTTSGKPNNGSEKKFNVGGVMFFQGS